MNDILPPKRPQSRPMSDVTAKPPSAPSPITVHPSLPPSQPTPPPESSKKRPIKKIILWIIASILLLGIMSLGAGWWWYQQQLQAVASGSKEYEKITIEQGSDTAQIGALLKEKNLIRSEWAFGIYTRMNGASAQLQSGAYRLSRSSDVPTIIDHLTSGKTDTFSITFLPGNTLLKHRKVFLDAGYDENVVDAAFAKKYDHPLFASRPDGANLEGYIYGETYQFPADATVEQILERTFDEYYKVIEDNNLKTLYKKRGLNLYEGITLASIIQREVVTEQDQKQVAQVFYLRLKKDMVLGSDVTYQYIADKTGVPRDPSLDSPYNTRRFEGLPPGPISSPGKGALLAVGAPASGNYVYFLSGDDDKTYFARTNEEHEKNIRDHCQKKCEIL